MSALKAAVTILKFMAGGFGLVLFFYRNHLFAQYAREGTAIADSVHGILINNHGSYAYITAAQSSHLRELDLASGALIGVMILVDIIQRAISRSRL